MFNFRPNIGLPGFRVGLTVDEDGSVRRTIPDVSSTVAFGYDPYGHALQTTAPTAFSSPGMFYKAYGGLYPATYPGYEPVGGLPPSRDPPREKVDRAGNLYADIGGNPLSVVDPQALSTGPTAPAGNEAPSSQTAGSAPPASTAPEGFLRPDPQGYGGDLDSGYGASDPLNGNEPAGTTPHPMQNTSGDDGFRLIPSAQAQTPQAQAPKDSAPGHVVVLPDGSTVPDPKSPTGQLMSPVADLNAVAAAGRRTGFVHRAMLLMPLIAPGAPAFMLGSLYANVSQRGAFDYQRRGGQFLKQFTPVSNVNVGLFAQQAGLSLEETLTIAGAYARLFSGNARPGEPYGLHPDQLRFIELGFKIGQSGMFGSAATP